MDVYGSPLRRAVFLWARPMQLDSDPKPISLGDFLRDFALVVGVVVIAVAAVWLVTKLAVGLLLS